MRKSTFFAFSAGLMMATASAYAVETPSYTLTPAEGPVTELTKVTLEFPNTKLVSFVEGNRMPVASLENTTTGELYYCQEADRNTFAATDGVSFDLTFISEDNDEVLPVNQPGNYVLAIRGLVYGEGEDTEVLEPITAEYSIYYPIQYLLNPAASNKVTDLAKITLEFPDNRNVAFYENSRMAQVVLENTTNGKSYTSEPSRDTFAQTNGALYEFQFVGEGEDEVEPYITEPGEYTLTVKGLYLEAVEEEGENAELPIITAYYEIAYPVAYTLSPVPGAPASDLMTISLEFPENRNIAFYENSTMPVAVLEDLTNGTVYNCVEADHDTFAQTDGVLYKLIFTEEDLDEPIAITAPGEYLLTVRALGYQNEEGEMEESLPVLTARYNIPYPVDYVIYPLGNVVSNLQDVAIEFPNNRNIEFVDMVRGGVAALENLTTGVVYYCQEADPDTFAESEGIVYTFKFIGEDDDTPLETISQPGEYLLTIRGLVIKGGDDEEDTYLTPITKGYTINYPYEYYLTPEAGSEVNDLSIVTIEFPTTKNINFYENPRMPVAALVNNASGIEYVCYEPDPNYRAVTEGRAFDLVFLDEDGEAVTINQFGDYTLTIQGLYYQEPAEDDATENPNEMIDLPVITAHYTIAFPLEYVLDPVNGATVSDLMTVTLEFPTTTAVGFYENNPMSVGVLENTTNGVTYNCDTATRDTFAETDGILFKLIFIEEGEEEAAPIVADGIYTLTIRALATLDEDGQPAEDLPVINATYYIVDSGVKAAEFVGSDNGLFNVYTVNGLRVVNNGTADSLNGLKGLYIVNGKKVIIR